MDEQALTNAAHDIKRAPKYSSKYVLTSGEPFCSFIIKHRIIEKAMGQHDTRKLDIERGAFEGIRAIRVTYTFTRYICGAELETCGEGQGIVDSEGKSTG